MRAFKGDSAAELVKYLRAYAEPRYRRKSGLHIYEDEAAVRAWLKTRSCALSVDFGCGNGRAALLLLQIGAKHVTLCDFIGPEYLDPEVEAQRKAGAVTYVHDSLWELDPDELPNMDFAVCTDVMEHIPEPHVDSVLHNIADSLKEGGSAYFRIALWGSSTPEQKAKAQAKYGGELHVTVRHAAWWVDKLKGLWGNVEFTVWTHPTKTERSVLIAFCE